MFNCRGGLCIILSLPFNSFPRFTIGLCHVSIFHAFATKELQDLENFGGGRICINLLPLTAFATQAIKSIVTIASFICFATTNCRNSMAPFFLQTIEKSKGAKKSIIMKISFGS
ncbi:hypothetical protein CEXT_767761 [Caerostris extrusa]|uniref:Uncharacterized protein n=1 Tax=Caerostris extrusa TaxID=172846 RepID=A0AAV4UHR7_CAEEX|nr:hypothetical protein CEXT_767761 [Caerostris extrusa]